MNLLVSLLGPAVWAKVKVGFVIAAVLSLISYHFVALHNTRVETEVRLNAAFSAAAQEAATKERLRRAAIKASITKEFEQRIAALDKQETADQQELEAYEQDNPDTSNIVDERLFGLLRNR